MRQRLLLAASTTLFGVGLIVPCLAGTTDAPHPAAAAATDPLAQLATYLAQPPDKRPAPKDQTFTSSPLTKEQARAAAAMIWDDHLAQIRTSRKAEWEGKAITIGDRTLKFEKRVFGERPQGGRSLFISMHGGGGAPKQVNDQQWQNQIGLYKPKEGVYIAPRAPTDAWNMWHEAHMDGLLDRLIEDAVAFEEVNPDRVYIMGYSAGGDGVYQLGPRMADRWAAAAMMAGHPNDASPVNLRNLPFSIQCGGEDGAYNRNKVCREWGEKLDKLREADPQGYEHQCIIYEGLPHWMNRKDAQAVDWMLGHTRAAAPKKVVWRQDDVLQQRLYWVEMPKEEIRAGAEITASIEGQTIKLDSDKVKAVTLLLNDELIDLDKPVDVVFNGQKFSFSLLVRTIGQIEESLGERADARYLFPARVMVNLGPTARP